MSNLPVGPSPLDFYQAFLQVVEAEELKVKERWDNPREYTTLMRSSLFPQIAEKLCLQCYPDDYYYLDAIFYREKDAQNFASYTTYATSISVALEHENVPEDTAVEMNKLQLFSAPLKVLITYPARKNFDLLLTKYAGIIKAADVFDDISTLRRQLVIFGSLENDRVRWEGFEYYQGSFRVVGQSAAGCGLRPPSSEAAQSGCGERLWP
jgi:hypothetical protein